MTVISPVRATAAALAVGALLAGSQVAVADAATFYASPTGSTSADCSSPAQACELQRTLDQATSGSDVTLAPGTYTSAGGPFHTNTALDIHGQDGQPAPTIVNDHSGCGSNPSCLGQSTLRIGSPTGTVSHVRVTATGDAGQGADALDVFNAADSDRVTVEDVFAQSAGGAAIGTQGDVMVRDSVAWGPNSAFGALVSLGPPLNGTHPHTWLENVTAVGGPSAYGLILNANCIDASCGVDANAENTIVIGGHGDIQTSVNGGAGAVSLTAGHSNYRAVDPNVTPDDTNGNQSAQPQFVNAATGDFHELETSPTRDAGIAGADLGPVDLDGQARVFGSAPDIGADEWTPAPPPQQQGGQTGTSTTTNPALFHGVRLHGGTLRLRHGKLRVRVSCPPEAASYCKGGLRLKAAAHSSRVGSVKFTLKPGKSKQVSVTVSRKLRKLRHFKATVIATARDAGGHSYSTRVKVRVKRG